MLVGKLLVGLLAFLCGVLASRALQARRQARLKKRESSPFTPFHTSNQGDALLVHERDAFRRGACPDCGAELLRGSRGLMAEHARKLSHRLQCESPTCGSQFNDLNPFEVERLTRARPLERVRERS